MTRRYALLPIALSASIGLASAAQAQSDPGEAQFKQKCQMCHTVAPGGVSGPLAPNLRGVVGRKAGSIAFKTYSAPLKASGHIWTQANLDKFLTNPTRMVPGTRMVLAVPDPAQRAALLAWLARQK